MNTYSNLPKSWRFLIFLVPLLLMFFFLTGCQFPDPAANPESDKSTIQITVWDDQTQRPISKVELYLELPRQIFPIKYTDNTGRAVFEVNNDLLKGLSELKIQKEGYEPQTHMLMLSNSPVFSTYLVPVGATAVPRETPTITPIPATLQPNDTNTPVPLDTAVPTNTPVPTVTSTNTPPPTVPTGIVTLTRREGADTVYVLAGPDVINMRLGTLAANETAEVIGRTEENEWLKIINSSGFEGWVADCEVTLSTIDLNNVPVVWSGDVTAKSCGSDPLTPPSPSGCVTVSMTRTDWPGREFDDVLLTWSNVPSNATQLKLWVEGPTNDGVVAYVIHPTFSDTQTPYKVELFKFEDGDFKPGATYTYMVQPVNASGGIICTKQGTFIP